MKTRPKRVMIVETAGHGKLCHYTYSLCTALSLYGIDVTLVTSKDYELDQLPKNFKLLKIFPKHPILYPLYFLSFLREVRNIKPAILHLQWLPSPVLGLIFIETMKRLSPVKIVYTPHNILPHRRRFFFVRAWAKIYKKVDMIIAHSRYNRSVIADLFDIEFDHIAVIPDFLYFDHIVRYYSREGARKRLGLGDEKVILFFGYINRRKGIELLIRAFKGIREEIPAKLVIAGKPEGNFSYYESLIKDLQLEGDVILDLMYVPFERMLNYFAATDVVALPYLKVCASPIVQMAQSFRKPVITTEIAGVEGKGMVVVDPDITALKKAILSALNSPGKTGLRRHPTWKDIASLTVEVYNKTWEGNYGELL